MEVLGCVHLKQPLWQAEIDRYFDCDKRGQVVRLRELGLIEAVRDDQGRNQYITTEAFRQRFGSEAR
jgi:chromosome segregation and condensation protein ScpB